LLKIIRVVSQITEKPIERPDNFGAPVEFILGSAHSVLTEGVTLIAKTNRLAVSEGNLGRAVSPTIRVTGKPVVSHPLILMIRSNQA